MKGIEKVGLTIIVLSVVGLIVFLGYLFVPGALPGYVKPEPVNPPGWEFAGWWQGGHQVSEARVNQPVTLKILVSAGVAPVVGDLGVKIKKDVKWGEDVTVQSSAKAVSLIPNGEQTVAITFTPDEKTGTWVREYFFKLYWNNVPLYDPTTPGHRHALEVTD